MELQSSNDGDSCTGGNDKNGGYNTKESFMDYATNI